MLRNAIVNIRIISACVGILPHHVLVVGWWWVKTNTRHQC